MDICMGVYERGKEVIVGLCDKNLIGKRFKEGDRVLDLERYKSFYGSESREEEIKKKLMEATIINLVGEKSIKVCINSGVIKKVDLKKIIKINNVPHLQIVKVGYNED